MLEALRKELHARYPDEEFNLSIQLDAASPFHRLQITRLSEPKSTAEFTVSKDVSNQDTAAKIADLAEQVFNAVRSKK